MGNKLIQSCLISSSNFCIYCFGVVLSISCSFVAANTEDTCWATMSAPDQLIIDEPDLFLDELIQEVQILKQHYPVFTQEERERLMSLLDADLAGDKLSAKQEDEIELLMTKKEVGNFIISLESTLTYQKGAKRGDVKGYLFAVNLLQESLLANISVSFQVLNAEFHDFKVPRQGRLASLISNVGNPFLSSLSEQILICIIPQKI